MIVRPSFTVSGWAEMEQVAVCDRATSTRVTPPAVTTTLPTVALPTPGLLKVSVYVPGGTSKNE